MKNKTVHICVSLCCFFTLALSICLLTNLFSTRAYEYTKVDFAHVLVGEDNDPCENAKDTQKIIQCSGDPMSCTAKYDKTWTVNASLSGGYIIVVAGGLALTTPIPNGCETGTKDQEECPEQHSYNWTSGPGSVLKLKKSDCPQKIRMRCKPSPGNIDLFSREEFHDIVVKAFPGAPNPIRFKPATLLVPCIFCVPDPTTKKKFYCPGTNNTPIEYTSIEETCD